MIDLNKKATAADVSNMVKKHGVARIKGFINPAKMKKEVEGILAKEKEGKYAFGKAARTTYAQHIKARPGICEVFGSKWMREVTKLYLTRVAEFNKNIFITHDYINDQGLAPNGYLHFDRTYFFKFFIYLIDCDEKCGPLSCVIGSHIKGKKLRAKAKAKATSYQNFKNHVVDDYPKLGYKNSDATKMIGPAGTLVVFDTDTFHMGGCVDDGHERMIIRAHSR